jgi:hypothetical protein
LQCRAISGAGREKWYRQDCLILCDSNDYKARRVTMASPLLQLGNSAFRVTQRRSIVRQTHSVRIALFFLIRPLDDEKILRHEIASCAR